MEMRPTGSDAIHRFFFDFRAVKTEVSGRFAMLELLQVLDAAARMIKHQIHHIETSATFSTFWFD
jgi:hypothetical protein